MGDILNDISHELEKIDDSGVIKQLVCRMIVNTLKPFKAVFLIVVILFTMLLFSQLFILWNTIRIHNCLVLSVRQ
jgi:hypothetical protein